MGYICTKRSVKLNIHFIPNVPNNGQSTSMGTIPLEKDRIFQCDVAEMRSGLSEVTVKSENGKYIINVPFNYIVVADEKKFNSVKADLRYNNLAELLESAHGVFKDIPNVPEAESSEYK